MSKRRNLLDDDERLFRVFGAFVGIYLVLFLAFWAGVIFIELHFLGKYW